GRRAPAAGRLPAALRDMKRDTLRSRSPRLYWTAGGIAMTRPLILLSALLLACGSANAADHNRYKWRDAEGNLHYSDSLPAEAARLGYEIVNSQGIVVKRVQRAKTKDELAAAKVLAEREKAEREAAEVRARTDAQLLSGYPD